MGGEKRSTVVTREKEREPAWGRGGEEGGRKSSRIVGWHAVRQERRLGS